MWLSLIASPGFISRVCAFGVTVVRSDSAAGWAARRARRCVWMKREVDGLDAVRVAGPVGGAFQAVDGQRRAPVGVVAADLVGEGREAGRVELQLHERRARRPGTCRAARSRRSAACTAAAASELRVAEVRRDPGGDGQLEAVRRRRVRGGARSAGPCGSTGSRSIPGESLPEPGRDGEEPQRRLVVADVVAVVLEPLGRRRARVGARRRGLTGCWIGLKPLQSSPPAACGITWAAVAGRAGRPRRGRHRHRRGDHPHPGGETQPTSESVRTCHLAPFPLESLPRLTLCPRATRRKGVRRTATPVRWKRWTGSASATCTTGCTTPCTAAHLPSAGCTTSWSPGASSSSSGCCAG